MLKALFTWLGLSLCTLGYLGTTNNPVLAQVTSDDTVNTQVTENGNTAEITGGETRGDNLFHSFQDFSVRTGNEAFFNNADTISNIFSRVTGGNVSDIDGAIRANGSANLFLINPAGILFGENASLNIGGSFYGSSASSILFEDGEFSAADLDNPPLLTVNAPIGLGFRDNPQSITNRSQANNGDGLQVNIGENITLLGGDINFDGGIVFAPGGNVELGGLSAAGEIGISNNGSLSFPDGVARSDVSLQNGSRVDVTSGGGGSITVNARNLELQDSTIIAGISSGLGSPDAQAGDININATNNIALDGQSSNLTAIINSVFDNAIGNAGEINVSARNISLSNGSAINSFVNGQGNSSDITLNAGRNISIGGSNETTNSIVNSFIGASGEGNSGTTNITAQNLTLSNGGNISSLVSGVGDTGDLNINVRDSLAVDGEGILSIPSAINSVVALDAQGNSGDIKINTSKLSLRNGGQVNASIFSRGNAGNIDINSTESITLDGRGAQGGIFSQISSTVLPTAEGDGGNIDITSRGFAISNNANVDASTGGRGDGGEISIMANNLSLTNGGSVNAFTFGSDPDNITQGNAGDITINIADTLSIAGTSTMNFQGQVIETPAGIFASNLGNRIGNAGNIDINTENFSITNLARLNTSSTGQGDAGNISVNATNSFIADNQGLITSNVGSPSEEPAVGKVGNIFITARDIGLTGTAQIQAGAFPGARAEATGTVSLTASESISFTGNSTGIFSDNSPGSFGNASNTQLFAPTITLNDGAIIQASNAANGQGGNVTVESDQLILNRSNVNADARGNEGNGASISLNVAEDISLQNNSFISARAFNNADGGNLNINTNFIVAFPSNGNGNDIIASAEQGNGGNITINADSVLGIEERPLNDSTNDINASSEFDLDGSVNINTSDINPIQGATELPSNVVEAKQTADQTCSADREGKANNGLAIAGRGGVSPAPDSPLSSENISNENSAQASIPQPLQTTQGKIQPARGIKVTKSGKIILTAYRTNNTGERIPEIKPNCN